MTKEQVNVIEDILNTKFNDEDILNVYAGNRSQIYCINNKLAVKIFIKDYKAEIIAYEELKGLNFLSKFYGKNKEMKILLWNGLMVTFLIIIFKNIENYQITL